MLSAGNSDGLPASAIAAPKAWPWRKSGGQRRDHVGLFKGMLLYSSGGAHWTRTKSPMACRKSNRTCIDRRSLRPSKRHCDSQQQG